MRFSLILDDGEIVSPIICPDNPEHSFTSNKIVSSINKLCLWIMKHDKNVVSYKIVGDDYVR